jgi:hypothetical protein
MNKKQKIELGQKLVDLIYEVDGHYDNFLEECLDWKYCEENESVEDLTIEYTFKYPTWSVHILRNFYPPDENDINEGLEFGLMKHNQVHFDGDGEDFKEWLKENMSEVYESYE